MLHNMMGYAPMQKYVINTNGTRLLKDKDIERFKQYNLHMRVSIDGMGQVDEYVRQGNDFSKKLVVMQSSYQTF